MKDVEDFHRPNENMLFSVGVFDCLPTYLILPENRCYIIFLYCSGGDNYERYRTFFTVRQLIMRLGGTYTNANACYMV